METGITKQKAISLLTRSPHGALQEYLPIGRPFAEQEPEFFGHLLAWNEKNGSIRDAKVALPVIALAGSAADELEENALAGLATKDPRNLLRALDFSKTLTPRPPRFRMREVRAFVERYLRAREENWGWWERTALQHRKSVKALYARFRIKPCARADLILFKRQMPRGSAFEAVSKIAGMPAEAAAAAIINHGIPWLIAQGALGARAKEPELLMALVERMSPAELITNSATLERWGIQALAETRAAYEAALENAAQSKKAPRLKATRAAAAQSSKKTAEKLRGLQERQLDAPGAGIDGDWIVLGDKSASMGQAIEAAREVAATLARLVRGQVHLIFFDASPRYLDVTGLSYDEILEQTRHVIAGNATSYGVGLAYARERGLAAQGIAMVGDAQENTPPMIAQEYQRWVAERGEEPSVYLYRFATTMRNPGWDRDVVKSMTAEGIDVQEFDLTSGDVDYHSIPNLVQTMRVSRFSLLDEIMETPLLRLEDALRRRGRAA